MLSGKTLVIYSFILYFILWGCGTKNSNSNHVQDALIAKADSLNSIAWDVRRNDPSFADSLAKKSLQLSNDINYLPGKAMAYKVLAGTHWIRGLNHEALANADSAYQLFKEVSDTVQTGNLLNLKGLISWNLGRYEESSNYYLGALQIFEAIKDEDGVNKVYNNLGILNYQKGDFATALDYYNKARLYSERTSQTGALADVYDNIGIIYGVMKDTVRDFEFKRKALWVNRQSNDLKRLLLSYSNLGTGFFNYGVYDSSRRYLDSALNLSQQLEDQFTEAHVLNNLGELYINTGNLVEAKKALDRCKILRESLDDPLGLAIVHRNLGIISNQIKSLKESESYFRKSYEIATDIEANEQAMNACEELVALYQFQGKFKDANEYLQRYHQIKDSLFSKDQALRIQDLTLKYETEKRDKELVKSKAQLEINRKQEQLNRQRMIFAVIILILALISTWLYSLKKKLELQDKLKKEQDEKLILDLRLQNTVLEQDKLKQELDYKNKEITNFALMLVQKRELVDKITDLLIYYRDHRQHQSSQAFEELINEIRNAMLAEKETQEFEQYVDQVCEGFFVSLEHRFPGLTKNEKRLAALLRMNLSSKEISGVLNISPKSVDMNRYRLRKKLQIETEEELANFFARL